MGAGKRAESLLGLAQRPSNSQIIPTECLHGLQVLYDERAESALGPFSVEAKLTGQRGQQTFATGSGRAKNKQLAKQVRAEATAGLGLAGWVRGACWASRAGLG